MRRIIYISRSLTGNDPATLHAILEVSKARNSDAGITGMLWSDGRNFAQVIEGDDAEVGLTMDRVRGDSRHAGVEVISDRKVIARQFGTWAMRHADDGQESTAGTTYLIGFALNANTDAAKRLYDIIVATEKHLR